MPLPTTWVFTSLTTLPQLDPKECSRKNQHWTQLFSFIPFHGHIKRSKLLIIQKLYCDVGLIVIVDPHTLCVIVHKCSGTVLLKSDGILGVEMCELLYDTI